jgi:predicted RNase H-like HicB family nuclease
MKIKVVVHEAEEGGYWAEVPALPGCITEGDTWDQLIANVQEAIEGVLAARQEGAEAPAGGRLIEIAV